MEAIRKFGEIPFWNPFNYSGNYHAGLSETGVFYPLNLIFFLLPQPIAWSVMLLIEPFLIGLGMYLFLKMMLVNRASSAFGATVLATSALVIVRMVEGENVGQTLLWMPYILWAIESYFQSERLRWPFLLSIFLVCSFTAGWFQYTAYAAGLGIVFMLYRFIRLQQKENKHIRLWPILIPFIIFPLLALDHVIPAIQAFADSPRGLQTDPKLLIWNLAPMMHLITLVFPDFWEIRRRLIISVNCLTRSHWLPSELCQCCLRFSEYDNGKSGMRRDFSFRYWQFPD